MHVGARHGGQVFARQQDALAADGIVGRERLAQRRIGHLPLQHLVEGPAHGPMHQALEAREGQRARLVLQVDPGAVQARGAGHEAEQGLLQPAVGPVGARHHVAGRALEDMQLAHLASDGGHELDGRCAGADHRHALAGQLHAVVPARRVEAGAGEVLDAGDGRQRRPAELAGAADQELRGQPLAALQLHPPALAGFVPRGRGDFAVEAHMAQQVVAARAMAQVIEDLRLRREHAAPARVGLEGERIQVRGHIAGRSRIGVVAPDAADVPGLFEDGEVVDAGLAQRDRHAQPGEAGADDEEAEGRGAGNRGRGLRRSHGQPPAAWLAKRRRPAQRAGVQV